MLLAPTDKPFDFRQPPRLSLGLAALLLVLFAWLSPLDSARQSSLNDYYQQHLLQVEWPLYPTHLMQSQQTAKLDDLKAAYSQKDFSALGQQLGFDRRFNDSITANGDSFLEPDVLSQWRQDRQQYNQERERLITQILGLDPQRFRPITFFTYFLVDHNSFNVLTTVLLLLMVGMLVEWAMSSGALLSAWLVGSLAAGIGYSVLHLNSVEPLIGGTAAISGVLGLAFMNFRHARSITVYNTSIFLSGWLFLALFVLLAVITFLNHQLDTGLLISLALSFGSGTVVCLAYNRWFHRANETEEDDEVQTHDEMPADELYRHELHHSLVKISQMQFVAAEKQLRELSEKYPHDRRILEHLYHLLKSKPAELEFEEMACGLFALPNQKNANHLVLTIYNDYKKRSKTFVALDADTCLQLAMRFTRIEAFKEAEEIFKRGLDSKKPSPLLKKAALTLSQALATHNQEQRAQYYQRLATAADELKA